MRKFKRFIATFLVLILFIGLFPTSLIVRAENNIKQIDKELNGKITNGLIEQNTNIEYVNTLNILIPIGINISITPFILIICGSLMFFIIKRKRTNLIY